MVVKERFRDKQNNGTQWQSGIWHGKCPESEAATLDGLSYRKVLSRNVAHGEGESRSEELRSSFRDDASRRDA